MIKIFQTLLLFIGLFFIANPIKAIQISLDDIDLLKQASESLNQKATGSGFSTSGNAEKGNQEKKSSQSQFEKKESYQKLSRIEQQLQPSPLIKTKDIKGQLRFESSHMLTPYDKLSITVFGKKKLTDTTRITDNYDLEVSANGYVEFPEIGALSVGGLTIGDFKEVIEGILNDSLSFVKVSVLLKETQITLKQFGYELFESDMVEEAGSSLMVPDQYRLNIGDVINVQLYGNKSSSYAFEVSREGSIFIPDLGPINVLGLTFKSAHKLISNTISNEMIGVSSNITMGPLKGINIFVLGDVTHPGSHTLSSLSSLLNALVSSGGIKQIGSLRNIELKRYGKTISTLDLYDLLLKGDASKDRQLRNGDVIFVPPIGPTVAVQGAVKRPAIYELKGNETLKDVIEMSGGVLASSQINFAQIERISPNGDKTILDFDITNQNDLNTKIKDSDKIYIHAIIDLIEDGVHLSGYLKRPGVYQWKDGMKLLDVIPSMHVLQSNPDLNYVLIQRKTEPEKKIHFLTANLSNAFKNPLSDNNLLLQKNDSIMVFGKEMDRAKLVEPLIEVLEFQAGYGNPVKMVTIQGKVKHPGIYPMSDGMKVSDLICAAGGLLENAYDKTAELSRFTVPEKKYRKIEHIEIQLEDIIKNVRSSDIELQSQDVLQVKEIPSWSNTGFVEIIGEVKFPGIYTIKRDETLKSLVERAGGITDYAYPDAAIFLREELREREQQLLDEMSRRLESDLALFSLEKLQNDGGALQGFMTANSLLDKLKTTKAVGRLVIDFPKILKSKKKQGDVILKDGDKLIIPSKTQEVTVIGEVKFPTSHLFDEDLSRDDYIELSGGPTYKADEGEVYTIKASGKVLTYGEITPGDVIVMPLDIDRVNLLTKLSKITQIMYQISITAASLKTVGAF